MPVRRIAAGVEEVLRAHQGSERGEAEQLEERRDLDEPIPGSPGVGGREGGRQEERDRRAEGRDDVRNGRAQEDVEAPVAEALVEERRGRDEDRVITPMKVPAIWIVQVGSRSATNTAPAPMSAAITTYGESLGRRTASVTGIVARSTAVPARAMVHGLHASEREDQEAAEGREGPQ